MKTLDIVYASTPVEVILIHTLALRHLALPGGVLYLCSGYEDMAARLETGESVTFTASAMGISLPKRSSVGREDLQFAIDNVTGSSRRYMMAARQAGGQVHIEYRPYLSTDLSQPAEPPLRMVMTDYSDDRLSANVMGSFRNFMDLEWPYRRFTPDKYPGLKYS